MTRSDFTNFLARLRIRTRLVLGVALLLAIAWLLAPNYFPARGQKNAFDENIRKASTVSELASAAAARGLSRHAPVAVADSLASLRHSPDLLYYVVLDGEGRKFASFNDAAASRLKYEQFLAGAGVQGAPAIGPATARPNAPALPHTAISRDGSVFTMARVVRYRGLPVGTLVTAFSLQQVRRDIAREQASDARAALAAFAVGALFVLGLSMVITSPFERVETDLETHNRDLELRVEKRAQQLMEEISKRRKAQKKYQLLVDRNLAGIYVATTEGRILTCNDACARLFGYASAEALIAAGASIDYTNPRDRDSIMRRLRNDGSILNEEVELRAQSGESVWAVENIRLIPGEQEAVPRLEGMLLDITDRKRAEEEIAFKAYHDSLTGLPNRALLLDRLTLALSQAARKRQHLAVIFLDLDDLKTINDTLGHSMGDELLKLYANRLREILREGDTVARVGGDEFVILLPDAESGRGAEKVARKILQASLQPFPVEDEELYVTTSIGIALFPEDGLLGDDLLRAADGAMYRIKEAGGNGYEFCNRTANRTVGRLSLESELRLAIERNEFLVLFQPQVKIAGRNLVGAEALVRWQHPERAIVDPAGFITVAEQTGLIAAIGEIVLRKACQQGVDWIRAGHRTPRISVNVSPRQFYQRDFIGTIERILEETGFDPSLLELEITESVAMQKSDRSIRLLRSLRERGVTIAIDDFGTGQSSLSYLKDFPVDTVKIDKSFVRDIVTQPNDQSIVTAVLVLANELGLRTIAEGVETEDQCDFLSEHGCAEMQGYLISRPIPADELQRLFIPAATKIHSVRIPLSQ